MTGLVEDSGLCTSTGKEQSGNTLIILDPLPEPAKYGTIGVYSP